MQVDLWTAGAAATHTRYPAAGDRSELGGHAHLRGRRLHLLRPTRNDGLRYRESCGDLLHVFGMTDMRDGVYRMDGSAAAWAGRTIIP
jgi:hypothetical protein